MPEQNERNHVEKNYRDRTGEILGLLRNPCVDFNRQSEKYWGCTFSKMPNGKTRVIAASSYYCIIIENIDASFQEQYFDFYENKWSKENTYPVSDDELINVSHMMDGKSNGSVIIAQNNMINWLSQFPRVVLQKSRVIVSPGFLNKDEIILVFHQEQGYKASIVDKIGTFLIDRDDSNIPDEFINIGQPYKAKITKKDGDKILVNVLEPFGKVRFGLKMSPTVFDPADMEKHVRLEGLVNPETKRFGVMPHNSIVTTSAIQSNEPNWMPIPVHIDASMLSAIVKIFALSDNKLMRLNFVNDPNAPVVLESLDGKDGDVKVKVVLATLNPSFGMQMR